MNLNETVHVNSQKIPIPFGEKIRFEGGDLFMTIIIASDGHVHTCSAGLLLVGGEITVNARVCPTFTGQISIFAIAGMDLSDVDGIFAPSQTFFPLGSFPDGYFGKRSIWRVM